MLDFLKKILHDSPILLLLSLNDRLKRLERVIIYNNAAKAFRKSPYQNNVEKGHENIVGIYCH